MTGLLRTVVIIDDHSLFREGIEAILRADVSLRVLAQGASSQDALELVALHRPEVLLLDVEIPGEPAESTVRSVRRSFPEVAIVILTMHSDKVLEGQLLRAGAAQFVSKGVDSSTLIEIVKAVSASDLQRIRPNRAFEELDPKCILTLRELEVLRMISQACSNRDISQQLHIAEGTVKRHTTNMYVKLDATSRIDAIRRATRLGLLK